MKLKLAAGLSAAVILGFFVFLVLLGRGGEPGDAPVFFARPVMEVLPDVTLTDQMAKKIRFSLFRGKTVLVNLWATWCAPCVAEMPALDRLQDKLGSEEFEVVAIAMEKAEVAQIADFYRSNGIANLKIYIDAGREVAQKWAYEGLPTTILVGADGREMGRKTGPAQWDDQEIINILTSAL